MKNPRSPPQQQEEQEQEEEEQKSGLAHWAFVKAKKGGRNSAREYNCSKKKLQRKAINEKR